MWKKDQCLPGHDYMLHIAVTFLIREHTDAEDVEQVESQFVVVRNRAYHDYMFGSHKQYPQTVFWTIQIVTYDVKKKENFLQM